MDALGQVTMDWQRAAASRQRAERVVALTKVARASVAAGGEAAMLHTDKAWAVLQASRGGGRDGRPVVVELY
eukprot:9218591-Alexandrium_andersonii.AAC.1